jgi:hypothetical protein
MLTKDDDDRLNAKGQTREKSYFMANGTRASLMIIWLAGENCRSAQEKIDKAVYPTDGIKQDPPYLEGNSSLTLW